MPSLAITADREDGRQAVLSRQRSVIPEMLATLDTLTIAGQHHVIDKVVTFIEDQVRSANPRTGRRNRAKLAGLMEGLKQESHHLLPDVASIEQHARTLMALIAAVQ
jgi:hypothetical protein